MVGFFLLKPVRIVASIIGGGLFVVLLIWIANTYTIPLAISLLAVTIATVAALANLLSLQWTRDTIRPFLSCVGGHIKAEQVGTYIRIPFSIHNSGSLPATDVDVDIDLFFKDEVVTEDNISNSFAKATKSSSTTMIHPNGDYTEQYVLDLKDKADSELWESIKQGKVIIRFRIFYKSLGRKHLTIQTEKMSKPEWEKGLIFEPTTPQKWQ